jgi:hypothetical protein
MGKEKAESNGERERQSRSWNVHVNRTDSLVRLFVGMCEVCTVEFAMALKEETLFKETIG